MCRSSAEGGRRCSGSSAHRTRALNTARKQVERARHRLGAALASHDAAAIAAAETRLREAKERLAATHAEHPRTSTAGHTRGHDIRTEENAMHEDNASGTDSPKPTPRATNHVASGGQVGLQSEGDVTGATVVIAGTGVTAGSWHATQVGAQVRAAMDDLRQGMSRKPARASGSTRRTVHHDDGSVINIATGVVGIQARSEHGNTVHID